MAGYRFAFIAWVLCRGAGLVIKLALMSSVFVGQWMTSCYAQTRSLPTMQGNAEFIYRTPPGSIDWTGDHTVSLKIDVPMQTQFVSGPPVATFNISAEDHPRPPLFQLRIDATRPATNTAAQSFRFKFKPKPRSSIAADRSTPSECVFEFEEGATSASLIHRVPLWSTFGLLDIEIRDVDDDEVGEVGQLAFPSVASMTSVQIYDGEYENDVWLMDDSSAKQTIDDWRSLIKLDLIAGSRRQFTEFTRDDKSRSTLLAWIHQGGVLVEWNDGSQSPSIQSVYRLGDSMELDFEPHNAGLLLNGSVRKQFRLGLGRVVLAGSMPKYEDDQIELLNRVASAIPSNMVRMGVDPVMGSPGYDRWLIEGVSQPPVYTFIGMLTVFMLLVGPVAYRLTVYTGRGHLMFILAPILAIVTTVVMLLYGVCVDGFSPQARVRQVTYLDSANEQSFTRSRETHFAPRGISKPFQLPNQSIFVDYRPASVGFRYAVSPAAAATFEQRGDLTFVKPDWLPLREQKQCIWMAPKQAAGRMSLVKSGESWLLRNQSRMTLVHPFVKTPDGETWSYDQAAVMPDQEVPLERVPNAELVDRLRLLHDPFRPIDMTNSQTFRNVVDMIGDLLSGVRSQEANDGLLEWQLMEFLIGLKPMRPGEFLALVTIDPRDCLIEDAHLVQSVGYAMGTLVIESSDSESDSEDVDP